MTTQKSEPKTYPLTPTLRRYWYVLDTMEASTRLAAHPIGFFRKKLDSAALIEVTKAFGNAKADFWNHVFLTYPELRGKDLTSNCNEIKLIES